MHARLRAMVRSARSVRSKLLRGLGLLLYMGAAFLVFALAAYTSFSLFVRSGGTRAPDLAGLTRSEASAALADQGLELASVDTALRYDDRVPAGHIVQQSPDAGTLVKRGSVVQVILSQGPRLLKVPDLSGQALPSAQVSLAAAGLAVGQQLGVFSDRGAPGTVVEQDPTAGSSVPPATSVNLLIGLGQPRETYVMPDLIYRDYESVRQFFDQRGFRLGSIKYEPYEGISRGVILRQFPLAGHPLSHQDAISLVVAAALDDQGS